MQSLFERCMQPWALVLVQSVLLADEDSVKVNALCALLQLLRKLMRERGQLPLSLRQSLLQPVLQQLLPHLQHVLAALASCASEVDREADSEGDGQPAQWRTLAAEKAAARATAGRTPGLQMAWTSCCCCWHKEVRSAAGNVQLPSLCAACDCQRSCLRLSMPAERVGLAQWKSVILLACQRKGPLRERGLPQRAWHATQCLQICRCCADSHFVVQLTSLL